MIQFLILFPILLLHVPLYLQMGNSKQNVHINGVIFSKMFFERENWLNS